MPDIKAKLRTRLFRRASAGIPSPAVDNDQQQQQNEYTPETKHRYQNPHPAPATARASESNRVWSPTDSPPLEPTAQPHHRISIESQQDQQSADDTKNEDRHPATLRGTESSLMSTDQTPENSLMSSITNTEAPTDTPDVIVQQPTPEDTLWKPNPIDAAAPNIPSSKPVPSDTVPSIVRRQLFSEINFPSNDKNRKQSLIAHADLEVIRSLLQEDPNHPAIPEDVAFIPSSNTMPATTTAIHTGMLHRKIWVKKTGGAATMVLIREDDLVDDVKEAILKKYSNNLGKHYDAPDITIRIMSRDKPVERVLTPDEQMCRTLDTYYPNGQTVDEALVIDVPTKRTPRPSPRMYHPQMAYYYPPEETSRPNENGSDYFPPMPPVQSSPAALTNHSHESRHSHSGHERAMSVLNTGQVPPLPSPGGTRRAHIPHKGRPSFPRQLTSSPTALTTSVNSRANRPRLDSRASEEKHAPAAPPLPTPPAAEAAPAMVRQLSNPPIPRVSSPRPGQRRKTKQRPTPNDAETAKPTLTNHLSAYIDTSVPPINVLIVEDNHINMKLLEQFIRRLKVRWDTAVNGREAVTKWRRGGFHLVLMDIQLPIMSGIEATKEIRRLERVNRIGVFIHGGSSASSTAPVLDPRLRNDDAGEDEELSPDEDLPPPPPDKPVRSEDELADKTRLFKSPVIIVALTASNLQSDRHEALAAGCNDFLTKVRVPATLCRLRIPANTRRAARQLCVVRAQGQRVGLHAGADRLRRLAQVEGDRHRVQPQVGRHARRHPEAAAPQGPSQAPEPPESAPAEPGARSGRRLRAAGVMAWLSARGGRLDDGWRRAVWVVRARVCLPGSHRILALGACCWVGGRGCFASVLFQAMIFFDASLGFCRALSLKRRTQYHSEAFWARFLWWFAGCGTREVPGFGSLVGSC